ncbi:uncharacterized protein EAE98_005782 [Botrytis deweyae]|uniref:Uncharacterized protein n=1 Tax=Botrytis deweyae TaxID=2478750 RepID=A0ABQ7IMS0_9HELO|nr:uncharacterized protein EAE98_005782 [Botrytis deweyae]KAF7928726.1 hypothetical protein EAE98_005782 [Botrytis deweyae]
MTVNLPGRGLGQASLVGFISQLLLEVHRRRFGLALRCREMILWIRFYGFNLGREGMVWSGTASVKSVDSTTFKLYFVAPASLPLLCLTVDYI